MEIKIIDTRTYEAILSRIRELSEKLKDRTKHLSNGSVDNWLDNQDVCLLLRINLRTLQTYRENGKIPFSKIGNKIYYKRKDIELLIDKHSVRI